MKKILFCIVIFVLGFVGCKQNTVLHQINAPLYINSSTGIVTLDINTLRVKGKSLRIGQSIFAIASDKKNLYLSDSGNTELPSVQGDYLYIINRKIGRVNKTKAPGVDNMIVLKNKIFGLIDNTVLFIYNKKNNKLETLKAGDDINLITVFKGQTLIFSGNKIILRKQVGNKELFSLDANINQAFALGDNKLAVVVSKKLYHIDIKNSKILNTVDLKNVPIEKGFVYDNNYFNPISSDGSYTFESININSGKQGINIRLPQSPNNVLKSNNKLYFTFFYPHNNKNYLLIINSLTGKMIKRILIGKDPSGMILVNKTLFIANSGGASVSTVDTLKDSKIKDIKLEADPTAFATPIDAISAIKLGN